MCFNLIQPRISTEDNNRLTVPLVKEELHATLLEMHPNKSLGPDGFNPTFYQNFWDVCGNDVLEAAIVWLERGYFPASLNDTNICLIPKCVNPQNMKDFWPISFCNMVYKLVSKSLSNRLNFFLDKCVAEEQSAFVEGRSILDNVMIAIEVIHILSEGLKVVKLI